MTFPKNTFCDTILVLKVLHMLFLSRNRAKSIMLPRISLLAAIVVLVAIILRTTEHEFAVEEVIETHSFNTYHFLADPLAVHKIYPPVAR